MVSAFDIRRGDEAVPIGRLAIDGGGQISLLSADTDYEAPLRAIIAGVNESGTLRIKGPSESGTLGAIVFQEVPREDPGRREAVVEFMAQKYDLVLETAPAD